MCLHDIYLAGTQDEAWRADFKKALTVPLTIFDTLADRCHDCDEQHAKEFNAIQNCNVVVFYFTKDLTAYTELLELGESVGRQKQVIVGIEAGNSAEGAIRKYCEYRGVLVASSIRELASIAQDCASQVHACQAL